jgi:hypothetical protein
VRTLLYKLAKDYLTVGELKGLKDALQQDYDQSGPNMPPKYTFDDEQLDQFLLQFVKLLMPNSFRRRPQQDDEG